MDVINEVEKVWNLCRIQTSEKKNSVLKIIKLHSKWKLLQKNHNRKNSKSQKIREMKFKSNLDELFDIVSHSKAYCLTQDQQNFINNQKNKPRRSVVGEFSQENFMETEDNMIVSQTSQLSDKSIASDNARSEKSSSSYTPDNCQREDSDEEQSKKINVLNPELVTALDRTNTSSRDAAIILKAAAKAFGVSPKKTTLSKSVIHRKRIEIRKNIATEIKKKRKFPSSLVLHWDGKLLPSISTHKIVDRLCVVVTGYNTNQLLEVSELVSGTGKNQADAIIKSLNDWNISKQIKAMCFDTTSTNTGCEKGACILLENSLSEQNLLHLACRHHIYELILRSVFENCWSEKTIGPDVKIFKRFQQLWDTIDVSQYETGLQKKSMVQALNGKTEAICDFISDQLTFKHPRDDNRELLELSYIFLGRTPPRGVHFQRPGAMHHARWLSKAIYSLKIYLFRKQFKIEKHEIKKFEDICLFVVIFYIQSWFTATSAIKAPYNDLLLMQSLNRYKVINNTVATAALSKLKLHLWYLSEDLAGFSFFDQSISCDIKLKMVQAMTTVEENLENRPRLKLSDDDIDQIVSKDISNFITKRSVFMFERFELKTDFLNVHPQLWENNMSFQEGLKFVEQLQVVNDIAERHVAMTKKYNGFLTKNLEQQQYLFQIIHQNRKE
ncbi:uncharacterized protein LOC122860551 [Aphidius gifuensis]|uniref:uncharacterized protein LOC122860551 n=1 Tax=Aphidius gifuensis TaxID=684658 RepID=UPI001CDD6CDA|nr:uncharacterized protein LOC122860551 [Aphidius gifuensis]